MPIDYCTCSRRTLILITNYDYVLQLLYIAGIILAALAISKLTQLGLVSSQRMQNHGDYSIFRLIEYCPHALICVALPGA